MRLPELLTVAGSGQELQFSMPTWWDDLENNEQLQQDSNLGIGIAYASIAVIALVQLIRIQVRVPEYGWTTQKVFHLLNAVVCLLRSGVFFFRPQLEFLSPEILKLLLLDLPGLLFFTTYTLLVLFWAEIYHQARSMPTGALRPAFVAFNILVYITQAVLWVLSSRPQLSIEVREAGTLGSDVLLLLVCMAAAISFLLYGGRLFLMLQRFPIESRGRRKKLREVGLVTAICAGSFSIRAMMIAASVFDRSDLELDQVGHPLLNILYYSLVEILPSAAVLFILRKLPPKRHTQGYVPIPNGQA